MGLEIITVRGIGRNRKQLEGLLKELKDCRPDVKIWIRQPEEGDLSIHLHQAEASHKAGTSVIGLRLAAELKDCGIVHHSSWYPFIGAERGGE